MEFKDFKLKTEDDQEIYVVNWRPENLDNAKAVVQIAHGMAEHIERYQDFARHLVNQGFVVYGNDHRGHGKTAGVLDNVGFLADEGGFFKTVDDLKQIGMKINSEFPALPRFLFGHSFGSLLFRSYVTRHDDAIAGLILSGTMGDPGFLGKAGLLVARLMSRIQGKRKPSPLLDKMTFGAFNNAFKPNRTAFDWLSRDDSTVDNYIDDPYCGFVCANSFFVDLLSGLSSVFEKTNLEKMPKQLPIYLFSGESDPVGKMGVDVKKVYQSYLDLGVEDVTLKLYENGRHEMLNEINRTDVYADTIAWLESHC